ncbi:protein C2-DOMAIN ABA-RELATED 11 isoform X1 [Coffea arabica]
MGQIKVEVVHGKRLVIRDFKSSDPYVLLKLGNQTAKTKVINSCLNPVWNEEFSFTFSEPVGVLKLETKEGEERNGRWESYPPSHTVEVFDKDRFKSDDKMGHAELSLQPLVAAARLKQILSVATDGMTLRKVIPESDNCLATESSIVWANGEVRQDVWLRLCDVESGEVELKIKLVNLPAVSPAR